MDIQDIIGYVNDIPCNDERNMEYRDEILRLLDEWEIGYSEDDEEDET